MQRMRFKIALLLCTLPCLTPAMASSDPTERGKELIQQALEKTNIFELPSFRMNANVRIDNFGKPLDGTYSLLWNGPDQWREEIAFPGYSEIQVGNQRVVYVKRSAPVMPYRIFQLHMALGFGTSGRGFGDQVPRTGETIKKVREVNLSGTKAQCVEIVGTSKITREVCVEVASGLLDRQRQGITDADWQPIGSKLFPRSISLTKNKSKIVEMQITQLDTSKLTGSGLFTAPEGAISRDGCMNPSPAAKVKDVDPLYPQMAKIARVQGIVATEVLIDNTGASKNLTIISTDSPLLNQATLDAVKQWRYEPATCNGEPVQIETVIEVRYSLQ
jgi:TonB family protein